MQKVIIFGPDWVAMYIIFIGCTFQGVNDFMWWSIKYFYVISTIEHKLILKCPLPHFDSGM